MMMITQIPNQTSDVITMAEIIFNKKLFTPLYWKLRNSNTRFVINYGGSSSSKSYSQMQLSIHRIMEDFHDGLVIRKYASDIENSVYDGIKDIINTWGITDLFKFTYSNQKREIRCIKSGGRILFKGLDDPDKIKSLYGVKWIYIEEANQLTEEDFRELNRRVRAIEGIQIFLVFNPVVITHWLKEYFFDNPVFKKSTTIFHSTYKDNPYNTAEDIEQLENLKFINENEYNVYALGRWGAIKTGQEYYSAFDYARHVGDPEYIPGIPIHISFDQNVVPYITMTIWQLFEKDNMYHVNQLGEILLRNPRNKTGELCKELLYKWGDRLKDGLFYYGDATGRNRDTRGISDYEIVELALRKYLSSASNRVPKKNPTHNKRREFINKVLAGQFNISILIHQKCELSITDLQMVQEDAEGKKHKRKKTDKQSGVQYEEFGHTSDTMDYLLMEAFKSYLS